ncbi:hypothetical protein FHX42_001807 [Saccharopolyspora lacisalsi]|uniref:DUF397 domain-containing protein n=1 Tax=Halosaccharopolyspora lacisalsi TaxID=1000566 RepID=A0A839DU58_9PSEU|nr:DUF397 domain-containing protein [Halosaccharopolyspora lacisalsi]MBA8824460.1 hypothetical protein [Halosaccharopolyspora lacisalsi]
MNESVPARTLANVTFRVSRFSGQNGHCVEIGQANAAFGVRDSKLRNSPVLAMTAERGRAFLNAIKRGRFDR